jgi:hypothetical protein
MTDHVAQCFRLIFMLISFGREKAMLSLIFAKLSLSDNQEDLSTHHCR